MNNKDQTPVTKMLRVQLADGRFYFVELFDAVEVTTVEEVDAKAIRPNQERTILLTDSRGKALGVGYLTHKVARHITTGE